MVVSVLIITHIIIIGAIMLATFIRAVSSRTVIIVIIMIGICYIHSEPPIVVRSIERTVERLLVHKPSVLRIRQYPAQIIISHIKQAIVIAQGFFASKHHIVHQITNVVNKVVVDFVHIVILRGRQMEFVGHAVG